MIWGVFLFLRNRLIYGQSEEPTSGLEPLTCSLRFLGSPPFKGFFLFLFFLILYIFFRFN